MEMRNYYVLFFCLCLFSLRLAAQPGQISLVNFAAGFNSPVDITHAGDERIFVVEQAGRIYILNQMGVRTPTPFLDIDPRVNSSGSERGLLGLAFHPDYAENGYFYVNYTNTSGNTVVSRFSVTSNPDVADPNSEVILLTINQPYSNHNGGCIKFGHDGYLYIGMGDGGSAGDPGNRSQDPLELLGKMLRIDVDNGTPYGIPTSNPYYGSSSVRNEIWAFGLRNPWRFSFDRVTGDTWIGDVGQGAWEEIDFWPMNASSSANYGWRCYEGNAAYNTGGCQAMSSYDFPVYEFSHAQGNCSVTGGFVYRGARYQSLWGYYFHTDYCGGYLWWTTDNGMGGWNTTRSASTYSTYNLVSFGEDVYGELYVAGIGNGIVYRLQDTTCTPVAYIPGADTLVLCQVGATLTAYGGPGLGYQWQLGGVDVSGATSASIQPAASGDYRVIVSNGSCRDTSNVIHVVLGSIPIVTLSLPDSSYCDTDVPVVATVAPPGGTLSGPGTTGTTFDPSSAGVGLHELVYAYTDSNGCSAADTFMVDVTVCVGVSAPTTPHLGLYPNPNNGEFELRFHLPGATQYQVEVMDLQGRRLHGLGYAGGAGTVVQTLAFPDLAPGTYLLRLRAGGETAVVKFSVLR